MQVSVKNNTSGCEELSIVMC